MSDAVPLPEADPQGSSFEEATRRLAQIVAELEGGDLPLDRSLALFEEGVRLARAAPRSGSIAPSGASRSCSASTRRASPSSARLEG